MRVHYKLGVLVLAVIYVTGNTLVYFTPRPVELTDLYVIIHRFDEWAVVHNVSYWAAYGTALGAVRHQALIPWDHDADLYVMGPSFPTDFPLLVRPTLTVRIVTKGWYQLFLPGSRLCVDVFLLFPSRKSNYTVWTRTTQSRLRMKRSSAWSIVYPGDLADSVRVPFGPITVPVFVNVTGYLHRTFGPTWLIPEN